MELALCVPGLVRTLDSLMGGEADQVVDLIASVPNEGLPVGRELFDAAQLLLQSTLLGCREIGLRFLSRVLASREGILFASNDHKLNDALNTDINAATIHFGEPLPMDHPVFSLAEKLVMTIEAPDGAKRFEEDHVLQEELTNLFVHDHRACARMSKHKREVDAAH